MTPARTVRLIASCLWLAAASGAASAAPVTLAWDPNPPGEQVAAYTIYRGTEALWTGPATTATLDLPAGAHTLQVTARNAWGESERSAPVTTPGVASTPTGVKLTVTISVDLAR